MKRLAFVALLLFTASSAQADSLTVTDMAFGTGIENHAITGVDTSFSADVGRVYCWTVTTGAGDGDTIFHTWILRDYAVQRVPLRVEGARYRTYTFKTMSEAMTGTWTVEVTDRNGIMLARDSVVVTGAATDGS
jgi:hypothetical protein